MLMVQCTNVMNRHQVLTSLVATLMGLTCKSEALLCSAWVTIASELPSGPVTSDCPLLPSSVPAAACLAAAGSLCATFRADLEAGWARRLAFA